MRKAFSLLLALVLTCLTVCPALGEADPEGTASAMSFYEGIYGNVVFQLPGTPERIRDGDMEDAWTDNWQLLGQCAEDGAEFQLHMADISQLIAYFREQFPDDGEDVSRAQALMNYGFFMPNSFGASLTDAQPHGSRATGNLWIDLHFTYEDTPDTPYVGRFMLSGAKAVCLVMLECEHAQTVMDALRFVSDAERDALLAAKNQPTYRALRGLRMTFPAPPQYFEDEETGVERLACFSADWSFIQVQYQPVGLTLNATDEEIQDSLVRIAADQMLAPFGTDQVLEPAMTRPAEHTVQLDFVFVNQNDLGEYGQRMLGRLYVGEYGIWYLYAPESDTGRAFLKTVRLVDEAAPEADPAAGPEPAAEPAGDVSTLPAFRQALEALLNRDNPDFVWKPGNFHWSEAVCSGGEWLRAVYLKDMDIGAALIKLDSSAPDAAIREIDMLHYAAVDGDEPEAAETLADWRACSKLCCLALRGDEALEEEQVEHPASTLRYDRARLLPRGAVPPVREEIPYPAESGIAVIPDSGVSFDAFMQRFNSLTGSGGPAFATLSYFTTQNGTRVCMYGEEVGVMVYTDGEADDASVDMIVLMATEPELAPKVLEATLLSFAAMTDMSPEEFVLGAYALLETPMWDELCELWPLLCRGNVCAHLQEDSLDGESIMPMGFVAGRPES